jgi:superfamily I DNA/RNA helicase
MRDEIERGVDPERIAFVTFTRKGAEEAKQRIKADLNIDMSRMPWVRTIHSMCFKLLSLRKSDVMGRDDYKELADHLGIEMTGVNVGAMSEGLGTASMAQGDRLLFIDTLARARCEDLKATWQEAGYDDILFNELELVSKTLKHYKEERSLIDFTGMLEDTANIAPLDIEVAIVDEAQDLSSLQWRVVKQLFSKASRWYVAGDDDQAIYHWAGADPKEFIELAGTEQILQQSYRVPSSIQSTAYTIARRIRNRRSKHWEPRNAKGEKHWEVYLDSIDINKYPGTWMILARNGYLVPQLKSWVESQGLLYSYHGGYKSINADHLNALTAWEAIRKGRMALAEHISDMLNVMRNEVIRMNREKFNKVKPDTAFSLETLIKTFDFKGPSPHKNWYEVMKGISFSKREYYAAIVRTGTNIMQKPRIHVDTIHSVKGGEADNVLLLTDMAYRSWLALQNPHHADAEHRVFYVAVTRAKERLFLMEPEGDKYYEF